MSDYKQSEHKERNKYHHRHSKEQSTCESPLRSSLKKSSRKSSPSPIKGDTRNGFTNHAKPYASHHTGSPDCQQPSSTIHQTRASNHQHRHPLVGHPNKHCERRHFENKTHNDPILPAKVVATAVRLTNDANEILREVKELSQRATSEKDSQGGKFVIMRKAPSSWRRDGSEEPIRNNGSQARF